MPEIPLKAQRWSSMIGRLPGVLAVFLSGSVAQGKSDKGSDLDFFIIARPGQIWTARLWVFLVLKFFNQIATEHKHAGRICPNHFITADHLQITEKDAYSAHLFSHNMPLYDPYGLWPKFISQNRWVRDFDQKFVVNPKPKNQNPKFANQKPIGAWSHKFEACARQIQEWKITTNSDFRLSGAKIVLEDHELRFHPKPRNKDWA